jgi:DNA primase
MINPFEEIRNRLSIKEVAERYSIEILHNNKALCPFHSDTHPSLSFKNGKFFKCFSCEAKGSIIDFVMLLFNLTATEAAKKLNEDFNLGFLKKI